MLYVDEVIARAHTPEELAKALPRFSIHFSPLYPPPFLAVTSIPPTNKNRVRLGCGLYPFLAVTVSGAHSLQAVSMRLWQCILLVR